MATVGYTTENLVGGVKIVTWSPLTSTNVDGTPFVCPMFADKSVQVYGTFGGATITVQGSNDSSSPTYATLADPQGNALTITLAKLEQILENTYVVRPLLSGGDGTTSITVKLLVSTPTAYDIYVADS